MKGAWKWQPADAGVPNLASGEAERKFQVSNSEIVNAER